MARRKRSRRKQRGLGALAIQKPESHDKEVLLSLLSIVAGVVGGTLVGRPSLLVSVPFLAGGLIWRMPKIVLFGTALGATTYIKRKSMETTTDGLGAFDFKQIGDGIKERFSLLAEDLAERLYLPSASKPQTNAPATPENTTRGLGADEDQVTYFINPYSDKDIDLSELDRIQEQIAAMNKLPMDKQSVNSIGETEPETEGEEWGESAAEEEILFDSQF